jgi:hypothetical protein
MIDIKVDFQFPLADPYGTADNNRRQVPDTLAKHLDQFSGCFKPVCRSDRQGDHVEVKPLDFLNALIARNMAENADRMPEQDGHEIHFAIGRGTKDGKPATVRCEVTLHPDPIYDGYVDAGTSMNASIAAQLILTGPRKPGVFACEGYFDPEVYFAEGRKRKFDIRLTVDG